MDRHGAPGDPSLPPLRHSANAAVDRIEETLDRRVIQHNTSRRNAMPAGQGQGAPPCLVGPHHISACAPQGPPPLRHVRACAHNRHSSAR
eukprot:4892557-Prymnesium_polylepis.1